MTETLTPVDPAELEGKTRAHLLEMCRARGLKATAWKRDRMFAALTGQDEAMPAAPKKNVLAGQLDARRQEREADAGAEARKARESMLKRTGACQSRNGCRCEQYEFERKDAFNWELCQCGHTQWAHAVGEPAR